MIKINNYIDKIKSFCDFTIEYDRSNKTYLFNNKYIDDIDCLEYEVSINILKSELIDVCIDIKKPQNFIKSVLIEIEKTAVWYEKERIDQFENFEKLSPIIVESKNNKTRETKSKYTIEQIMQLNQILTTCYST
jgi:CRISPR/Cas system endoribonuclease Cas6 (RAMP superfamily)